MTKLNVSYVGFKLGLRVADRLALDYRPGNELQSAALHAVRNMLVVEEGTKDLGICGINGVMHVGDR